jgi:hypothetical protein
VDAAEGRVGKNPGLKKKPAQWVFLFFLGFFGFFKIYLPKRGSFEGFYSFKQCGGSGMFIPDPGSDFFPSRIPDPNCLHPGSSSKNLSILTPKKCKKMVSKL